MERKSPAIEFKSDVLNFFATLAEALGATLAGASGTALLRIRLGGIVHKRGIVGRRNERREEGKKGRREKKREEKKKERKGKEGRREKEESCVKTEG